MKDVDKNITKCLLLVLSILIIMMIIYPVYKTVRKQKAKENFKETINNIITTAKKYYSQNTNFNDDYIIFTIKNGEIVEDGLNYSGPLPDSGSILINNVGEIQIVASDNNWCVTKRYAEDSLNIEEYSNTCEVIKSIKLGNISVALSPAKEGLYQENNVYYYRGKNPDNYIEINDVLFRIVSIDENNNLKLISNEKLFTSKWNTKSLTNNTYNIIDEGNIAYNINYLDMENEKFSNLRHDINVLEYSWPNLQFDYINNKTYNSFQYEEFSENIMAVVGFISASEYVRASLNNECILDSLRNTDCGIDNYLNISENYFTMSVSNDSIWAVSSDGKLYETSLNIELGIRPAIVLNGNIKLLGKGTIENPYNIKK